MKNCGALQDFSARLVDAVIERVEICRGGDFILTVKYQDIYELMKEYAIKMKEGQGWEP